MNATTASEWRDDVVSGLKGKVRPEVAELLGDHLLRSFGGLDIDVRLAAGEALQRRTIIARDEQLRVADKPAGRRWRGLYRLRPKGGRPRPWQVELRELEPLRASCSCPDFRSASLGACKHVVTVLNDLASRPRVWAAARREPAREPPPISWNPVETRPGRGDWLDRVELTSTPPRNRAARALWNQAEAAGRKGNGRVLQNLTGSAREQAVAALRAALRSSRRSDPALRALLDEEEHRLRRGRALAPARRRLPRVLASLRRRLLDFQVAAVRRFAETGRLVLADDMGLGKTTQAVAIAHLLARTGLVRRGLIVAPASLKAQWEAEWRATSPLPVDVVEGGPDQRAAAYRDDGFRIANYEQLLRDLDVLRDWDPGLVVLDEGQRIKNWATRTARAVKALHPEYRLVLTGTPFENRLGELDSILEWVDRRPLQPLWRLGPFHEVRDAEGGQPVGVRNLGLLRERLAPVLVRRRRNDVLGELPARTDHVICVPMSERQLDEHDALTEPIARIAHRARQRPLTQAEFLRLMSLLTMQRIIANGLAQAEFAEIEPQLRVTRPTERALHRLDSPKLDAIRDLLEALVVDQGRRVVVFSQWRRMLWLVEWACGPLLARHGVKVARFVGGQRAQERRKAVLAFHDDPEVRVMLATDAGGVGLNLQRAASACIHCDLPWNPAVFEQRVARIHRMGQRRPIDVHAVVAEPSIEARIHGIVQRKQALFSGLFDGDSDEVRFDEGGGFLDSVRRLVDLPADGTAERDEDDADAAEAEPEPDGPDDTPVDAGPAPADVASALAGLRVQRRDDGSLHIDAEPEAARLLSGALRALASALDP